MNTGLEELMKQHEEEFSQYVPFVAVETFVHKDQQLYKRPNFRRVMRNNPDIFDRLSETNDDTFFTLEQFINFITTVPEEPRKKLSIDFIREQYDHNPLVMNHLNERILHRDTIIVGPDDNELTKPRTHKQIASMLWEGDPIYVRTSVTRNMMSYKHIFKTPGFVTLEELITYVTQGMDDIKKQTMIDYISIEFAHNNNIMSHLKNQIFQRDNIVVGEGAEELTKKRRYRQIENIQVNGKRIFRKDSIPQVVHVHKDAFKLREGFVTIQELIDYSIKEHSESRALIAQYVSDNFSHNPEIMNYLNDKIKMLDTIVVTTSPHELTRELSYRQLAGLRYNGQEIYSKDAVGKMCAQSDIFKSQPRVTIKEVIDFSTSKLLSDRKKAMLSSILEHYQENAHVTEYLLKKVREGGKEYTSLVSLDALRNVHFKKQLQQTDMTNPLYLDSKKIMQAIPHFDKEMLQQLVKEEAVDYISRNASVFISLSSLLHATELQQSNSAFRLLSYYRSMTYQASLPRAIHAAYCGK